MRPPRWQTSPPVTSDVLQISTLLSSCLSHLVNAWFNSQPLILCSLTLAPNWMCCHLHQDHGGVSQTTWIIICIYMQGHSCLNSDATQEEGSDTHRRLRHKKGLHTHHRSWDSDSAGLRPTAFSSALWLECFILYKLLPYEIEPTHSDAPNHHLTWFYSSFLFWINFCWCIRRQSRLPWGFVKCSKLKKKCLYFYSTHLHLSTLVVAPIFVFVSCSVAVTEKAFEAVLAPQLPHDLVEGLAVEGVIVHSEGWIADGGKQGCVCVLPEAKCSHYTDNKLLDNLRIWMINSAVYQNIVEILFSVNRRAESKKSKPKSAESLRWIEGIHILIGRRVQEVQVWKMQPPLWHVTRKRQGDFVEKRFQGIFLLKALNWTRRSALGLLSSCFLSKLKWW